MNFRKYSKFKVIPQKLPKNLNITFRNKTRKHYFHVKKLGCCITWNYILSYIFLSNQ